MDYLTNETPFEPRSNRKPKPKSKLKRFLRVFGIVFLFSAIGGGSFLYGTDQGLQIRRMLLGTVFSTYHPQYEKFMELLLPKSEIDKMYAARNNPSAGSEQSSIDKPSDQTHVKASELSNYSDSIKVDTVETANYTAKIMIIPDPTTVHIVATKFTTKGQALSDLITENNGVAGINAGGFYDPSGRGSGGQMTGIVIGNGKVLNDQVNRDAGCTCWCFFEERRIYYRDLFD